MKKVLIILTIIVFIPVVAVYPQQRTATIVFNEESFDFGKINESDGPVSHIFSFTNTGTVPLLIQNAQPSCGCTTPDWTKQPVMPGAKGFIKATFDPSGRPGTFEKSVTVYSNADRSNVVLRFSGAVIPKPLTVQDEYRFTIGDLRLTTSYVSFGKLMLLGKRDTIIKVINAGKVPVSIKFPNMPPVLKAVMKPEILQPNQKGQLYVTYDASKKNDWGFLFDYLNFTINNKQDPSYKITVSSEIVEDFSKLTPAQLEKAPRAKFENTTFTFGAIKEGQKVEYEYKFKNEGKSDLILHKITTSCGCTTTNPKDMTIKAGAASSIKVTFDSSGKKGTQNKTITVITNDPKSPSILLWVKGTVQ
ncbi:MAG TPA: DUF1573 domain-containing protein [Bacteroidales bacterium]